MPVFDLARHRTNARREILAGCTTFLTMAYIMFLNPAILAETDMDFGAVFVATCVLGRVRVDRHGPDRELSGRARARHGAERLLRLRRRAERGGELADGARRGVRRGRRVRRAERCCPCASGSSTRFRARSSSASRRASGFFLAFIGLRNAGLVVASSATSSRSARSRCTGRSSRLRGFALIVALDRRGVPGAVLIGVLAITAISASLGYVEWRGVFALPPDPSPTLMQLDIGGALKVGMLSTVLTFLLIDLFDNAGTLVGVAHEADMLDEQGRLPPARARTARRQ